MSSADWLWDIQRDGLKYHVSSSLQHSGVCLKAHSIQETHFAQGMPQQVEELQAAGE
jgi:hypothetical protein